MCKPQYVTIIFQATDIQIRTVSKKNKTNIAGSICSLDDIIYTCTMDYYLALDVE